MKKYIARLFIAMMLMTMFAFTGCNKKDDEVIIDISPDITASKKEDELPILTGYFLANKNGGGMIITFEGYPSGNAVSMRNDSGNDDIFNNLQNGDKIKATYNGMIAETFPSQTTIYDCELVESGTIDNIPQDLLDSLTEMGWIE